MAHLNKYTHTRIFGLVLLFLCSSLSAQKSSEAEKFQIDSTLHAYYDRCRSNRSLPVVLSMSDTLFQMSKAKGDQRMQAVALSTKLDYYYYKGMEDSVLIHTNHVKAFAKATNQSKYYYFAWGKRLIMLYIKKGMFNTAFYEADKMLKEAQKTNDKNGLATCYKCLGDIYTLKKMQKQALDCYLKEVYLINTYQLDDYNISLIYAQISEYYINQDDPQKALPYIKKAEESAHTPSQRTSYMAQYIRYYLSIEQPEKASKYLQEMQQLYRSNKQLSISTQNLFTSETTYYFKTKQYNKALEAIEKNEKRQETLKEEGIQVTLFRKKGVILYQIGDYKSAYQNLMKYIQTQDSIGNVSEQNSTSEFATLLGIEKLNTENKELQVKAQNEQLQYTRNITFLLVGILLIGFCFLLREYVLNKRLRNSENRLIEKNNRLTESEEQLRKAKENAEKSSQMKSIFIQNMTHEIRTPLNSIVGFSQVISNVYQDNSETQEFANIIEENSNKLLKLVSDVLDISDIESNEGLKVNAVNINDCCALSIEQVKPYIQQGVNLQFHPTYDDLILNSNGERISQILFNLLHNAAKFTREGSIELSYHLSEDQSTLFVTITDTGIGVPDDKQNDIFDRFVKVCDFSQGFGLGLSIGQLLAHKLDGDLIIDKTYKTGCRFILSLPYQPA